MSPGLEAGPYLVWAFDLPDPLTRVITAGSCGPSTGSFCLLWSKWEFKQTLLGWSSILRGIITHRVEGRYLCAKKWGAPAGSGRGSTHVSLWVKLGGLQAHARVSLGWSLEACRPGPQNFTTRCCSLIVDDTAFAQGASALQSWLGSDQKVGWWAAWFWL